ncbi:hypothetical protein VPH35_036165 [Triticum aestivum]
MAHPPPLLSSPPTSVASIQAEYPQSRCSVLNPALSLRSTPGISAATLHGEIGRRPLREIHGRRRRCRPPRRGMWNCGGWADASPRPSLSGGSHRTGVSGAPGLVGQAEAFPAPGPMLVGAS